MVKAGQIYKAAARRGVRYVHVDQVRSPEQSAYALCHEVMPDGSNAHGWLHGVPRNLPMVVALRWVAREWRMPPGYTLQDECPVCHAPFAARCKSCGFGEAQAEGGQ